MEKMNHLSSSTDEEDSRERRGNEKAVSWEYIWQLQGPTGGPLWLEPLK